MPTQSTAGTLQPVMARSTSCPALQLTTNWSLLEFIHGATKWQALPTPITPFCLDFPDIQGFSATSGTALREDLSASLSSPAPLPTQCVCPSLPAVSPARFQYQPASPSHPEHWPRTWNTHSSKARLCHTSSSTRQPCDLRQATAPLRTSVSFSKK